MQQISYSPTQARSAVPLQPKLLVPRNGLHHDDTHQQRAHRQHELRLVEALAQHVKRPTRRHPASKQVETVSEHETRALELGRRSDEVADTEHGVTVRDDHARVFREERLVWDEAFFLVGGRGLAETAARVEKTAREAENLVLCVGEEQGARRDAMLGGGRGESDSAADRDEAVFDGMNGNAGDIVARGIVAVKVVSIQPCAILNVSTNLEVRASGPSPSYSSTVTVR